jgi:hypothetical protein
MNARVANRLGIMQPENEEEVGVWSRCLYKRSSVLVFLKCGWFGVGGGGSLSHLSVTRLPRNNATGK